MSKHDEIFELDKIPDEIIIKQLLVENGKLKSEIDYINNEVLHKQSGNSEYIRSLEGQVKNLLNKIDQLVNSNSLVMKQQNKITELETILVSRNKRIDFLEKELFKTIKVG